MSGELIPRDKALFLTWCQTHAMAFEGTPTAIGLTAAQVTAFQNLLNAYSESATAQAAAKDAAKSATVTASANEKALRSSASDLVRAIKSFAATAANPTVVYATAQIPPPGVPTPIAPPGQPTEFKVELEPGGLLTLKWKAVHPEGSVNVVYLVKRRLGIDPAEPFELLGASGERSYTDDELPLGVDSVSYMVQAQRGKVFGLPSQQLTITIGSVAPTALRGSGTPSIKLAA